jgi:Sulfotransferase family
VPGKLPAVTAEAEATASRRASGPVVVLAYPFSGLPALSAVLTAQPGLTCTSGTGVIPACAQALAAWKRVEGNPGATSALARSSVRALAGSMITCILAASGGSRWCETMTAPAGVAESFAELFPQAQFMCLHRACPQVISAATQVSRWGLVSAGVADFAAMHPGNNVAAVGAYWCTLTRAMLDFEAARPGRVCRVRYEDLIASPAGTAGSVLDFLGLGQPGPGVPDLPGPGQDAQSGGQDLLPGGQDEQIPMDMIGEPMLARINALHAELGYPPLRRPEAP